MIALCGVTARAQYENGSLIGSIHDATGAALNNASVTATNIATGIATKTTVTASGDYELLSLRAGVYNIEASAPGFAAAVAKNITVSVGGRQHIDLTLKVGQADVQTIEVSDVALQLETASSEHDQTVSEYQTESLPLVSRNYSDLLALVAGSRQAPSAATITSTTSLTRAGAYNVNGQRSMFNNYLLDGMDNNAYGESNQGFDNQIIQPPPDSINQFQVVTNNESAEYGRASGATINVSSRSGTNQFHATLYEFLRNTDLNAFGYIKSVYAGNNGTVQAAPKPAFNRNQFGANFGGPLAKNKLFYFLDYEGFRQKLSPTVFFTVPTMNELGLVSGSAASPQPVLAVNVRNPLTGAAYAAGQPIPTSAINPTSLKILGFFAKLPANCLAAPGATGINTTPTSTGYGLDPYDCTSNAAFTDNADKGDLRIDYQQSNNSSWFLKISDRKETAINHPTEPLPLDGQGNGNGRIKILDRQVALGYTHILSANKIIEARLALSGTQAGKYSLSIGNNALTIPGLPTDATVAGGIPTSAFGGGFSTFGRQNTNPQWQNPSLLDPKVNFAWALGHHSLKLGYEYEHVWMEVQDSNPLYGAWGFAAGYSNGGTPTTYSEYYWSDFLFGLSYQYQLATYFKAHLLQSMDSAYIQDDWKVSPKLTLNLGLRYEYGSPYSEVNNNLSNFDPTTQTMLTLDKGVQQSTYVTPYSGGGVYGKSLVNPSLGDWAPRIGFAYQLTPETVLRGGYGSSFVHYTRAGSGDILAINSPHAQFVTVTQPVAPSSASVCAGTAATSCYVTIDQGFPAGLTSSASFSPTTANVVYIPKDTKDSYVESYFLSLQRSLGKNTLVDLSYIGSHGLKLQGFLNANQKNPSNNFARPYSNWAGDITTAMNEFYSHYNALQARFEQHVANGLTLLNSFTWEHALDNASAALEGNTPAPQDGNNLRGDYGQSDYNLPLSNITSLVYELPVGRGKTFLSNANMLTDTLLGGWQVSGINTMQGGTPFNVTYAVNAKAVNNLSPMIPASSTWRGPNMYRPNRVAGAALVNCHNGHSCLAQRASNGAINYINLSAFTLPASVDANGNPLSPFGNTSRNVGRTPNFFQTDLDLNKKFNTPVDRIKVEFRAELYNILNHTNLYLPSGGMGTAPSTSATPAPTAGNGTVSGTFEPRIVQFGLKVTY